MEKDGREGLSAFFGYLALIFFILANLYTPAKWIVKHKLVQDVQVLRKKLKTLFQIHVQCNIMMFIFAIIHAHYSSQINFFLVVPMLIFAWLIFGGAFMMTRLRMHKEFREYVRMLHAQQYLFWVAIVFLIIGHIIIG